MSPDRTSTNSSAINRENTLQLIHLDVQRTFPTLGIFQPGGPYYDLLLKLLCAYVSYRPDVGYVSTHAHVSISYKCVGAKYVIHRCCSAAQHGGV
jgi:hypothetical protein